ncbi:MAG TPA: SPOR domain-containing protein [Cellvibrionaceae bacterium]
MNDGLKQRLIGALILAAVAVIFIPGFFKERSPYQVDTTTQIPAQPTVVQITPEPPRRVANIDPSPEPQTMFVPSAEQPVVEEVIEDDTAAAEVVAEPQQVEAASEAVAEAASEETDGLIPGAWVVQVASLSREESAFELRDRLQSRGHKAYVRHVNTAQGRVSRVYIGPKFERETALAIKREIDPVFKVDALVLQFKP